MANQRLKPTVLRIFLRPSASRRRGDPPNPKGGFDGIVVRCQVLEREPPSRLACSWSAGPIIDRQVIYRPESKLLRWAKFALLARSDLSSPIASNHRSLFKMC